MQENPRPEEESIIKDISNLFRLRREQNYSAIKDIAKFFRLEKKKLKQLKIEYLGISRIFLSMKKKKIVNQ